jgi:hypothetical protein
MIKIRKRKVYFENIIRILIYALKPVSNEVSNNKTALKHAQVLLVITVF